MEADTKEIKTLSRNITAPVCSWEENKNSVRQTTLSVIHNSVKKEEKPVQTPKSVSRTSTTSMTSPSFLPPCGDSFFDDDSYLPSTLASYKENSVSKLPAVISSEKILQDKNSKRGSLPDINNSLNILEASEPIEIHSDEDMDLFPTNFEDSKSAPECHPVNRLNIETESSDTLTDEPAASFTGILLLSKNSVRNI